MRTILVQGAMEAEIDLFLKSLPSKKTEINGYLFYEAFLNDTRIVISLTDIGIIKSAISTVIGIENYKPDFVINCGTAGGHTTDMHVGDIIIGESAIYLNNPRTPIKSEGEGSNALEWIPGFRGTFILHADEKLVEAAKKIPYKGRVIVGRLGSGDIYSREVDRIKLLHEQLGELSEDMESVSVYKACEAFNTPVIGIRIISNNEINGNIDVEQQFKETEKEIQLFVLRLLNSLT